MEANGRIYAYRRPRGLCALGFSGGWRRCFVRGIFSIGKPTLFVGTKRKVRVQKIARWLINFPIDYRTIKNFSVISPIFTK
jgi:hypothetical protein